MLLLSSVFLGIIFLFIYTKDRWNWKKIIKRFVLTIITFTILSFLGFYSYNYYINSPKIINEFNGIKLGTTLSDLKFIKGEPSHISKREPSKIIYQYNDFTYVVENNIVTLIMFIQTNIDNLNFVELEGGISINDNLDDIIKKYHIPSKIIESADRLTRIYYFDKYHIFVVAEKNIIIEFGIYNPKSKARVNFR